MTDGCAQRSSARGRAGSIERWTLSACSRFIGVERCALRRDGGVFLGKKTVINRLNFSPTDFFHVYALANPFCAQGRKSLCHIAVKIRITPRPARVVHAHGFVHFNLARHRLCRGERDFTERNPNVGMQLSRNESLLRIWKLPVMLAHRERQNLETMNPGNGTKNS